MMNDEELGILVEGYCRKIKRICDEIVYIDNNKVQMWLDNKMSEAVTREKEEEE